MSMCVGIGVCVCMSVSVRVRVSVSVSEGQVIVNGSWRVTPLVALEFKPLLHSLSMCGDCVRKADSSEPGAPHPSVYRPACHPYVAPDARTPFEAAAVQEAQDGCSSGGVGRHVMRVS